MHDRSGSKEVFPMSAIKRRTIVPRLFASLSLAAVLFVPIMESAAQAPEKDASKPTVAPATTPTPTPAAAPTTAPTAPEPDPQEKAMWHFKAAKAAFLAKRLDEAEAELRTVMELDPQPIVMYNMARVLEEKNKIADAVEWYLKALRSGLSGDLATSATARVEVLGRLAKDAGTNDAALSVVVPESEARVFLDDKLLGQGSLKGVAVSAGQHVAKVEHPSYEVWRKEIEVAAGDKLVLDVSLVPLVKVGRLTVQCAISGAALSIDGQPVGLLPIEDLALTPGKHAARVEAEGYDPFVTEVDIKEQQTMLINAALAQTDNSGRLLVETDVPGAQVSIDGMPVGKTPVDAVKLSPGTHALTVIAEGYAKYQKDVVVPPRQFLLYQVPLVNEAVMEESNRRMASGVKYDSFISLYTGIEKWPGRIPAEALKSADDYDFTREYFAIGIEYVPNGLHSGLEMRFWGGARFPTSETDPDDVVTDHTGIGGGALLYAHVTVANRVEAFFGGGLQWFYNFEGKDEDAKDHNSWHEISAPIGGGVSVRPWEWLVVSPEFLYYWHIPEVAGGELEDIFAQRNYWLMRVGIGWAYPDDSRK